MDRKANPKQSKEIEQVSLSFLLLEIMSLRDGEIKAPQADQAAATAKPSGTAEQPPWKMRENRVVIVNRCPVVSPSSGILITVLPGYMQTQCSTFFV